jgi:hypothetical protein
MQRRDGKLPHSENAYQDLLRGLSIEIEGRRECPVNVDLGCQIGDSLLSGGNGISTCDKAARRWLLVRNHNQCFCEFGRVAGLLAILGFPKFELLRSAVVIILD